MAVIRLGKSARDCNVWTKQQTDEVVSGKSNNSSYCLGTRTAKLDSDVQVVLARVSIRLMKVV
jgi:hypothetical protein